MLFDDIILYIELFVIKWLLIWVHTFVNSFVHLRNGFILRMCTGTCIGKVVRWTPICLEVLRFLLDLMDSSTKFQAPPQAAYSLWSCEKVYHKQEVCFLLYFLCQIVSWQYNPKLLDKNWPCTVINDHDWQLWNCPLKRKFKTLKQSRIMFIWMLMWELLCIT